MLFLVRASPASLPPACGSVLWGSTESVGATGAWMLKEQEDSLLQVAGIREGPAARVEGQAGAPKVQASRSRGTEAAEQVSRGTDHTVHGGEALLSHSERA